MSKPGTPKLLASRLGQYPPTNGYVRVEFQVERLLVWVMYPEGQSEREHVLSADEILPALLDDVPNAVSVAEEASRWHLRKFWELHDISGREQSPLSVWSITIHSANLSAEYDVYYSHDYDFEAPVFEVNDVDRERPIVLPEFPEELVAVVERTTAGRMILRPR